MEKTLKELMAKAKAILDAADSQAGGVMTAEQEAEFDLLNAEIVSLKAQIAKRADFGTLEGALSAGTGRVAAPTSITNVRDRIDDDPKAGFSCVGEFAAAVRAANPALGGRFDERLNILGAPSGYMQSLGSDEGFMVPPEFRTGIWEVVEGSETSYDLFNLMPPEPTGSNTVEIIRDETTPWGGTGVQAYYGAETGQMTASSLVTKASQVALNHCYAYVLAGEDLLEDAPRLSDRLTNKAGQALRYKLSNGLIEGDGVGKPLGIKNAACLVSVAKESGQTGATVTATNVVKMYSRAINPTQGFWIVNPDVMPQIILLTVNSNPIWMPYDQGFKYAPMGTLLGRPIYPLEHCQTVGTVGDIYFVNPNGYMHVMKNSGIKYAESIHLYFDYNIKAFRWTVRHTGMPYLSAAISPKNGSNTRSHFVALATR